MIMWNRRMPDVRRVDRVTDSMSIRRVGRLMPVILMRYGIDVTDEPYQSGNDENLVLQGLPKLCPV